MSKMGFVYYLVIGVISLVGSALSFWNYEPLKAISLIFFSILSIRWGLNLKRWSPLLLLLSAVFIISALLGQKAHANFFNLAKINTKNRAVLLETNPECSPVDQPDKNKRILYKEIAEKGREVCLGSDTIETMKFARNAAKLIYDETDGKLARLRKIMKKGSEVACKELYKEAQRLCPGELRDVNDGPL